MKHVGSRPEFLPLELDDTRKQYIWYENFPDGGYRIWNNKTLNSGCGTHLTDIKREGNLIFCNRCKEWANENQFVE